MPKKPKPKDTPSPASPTPTPPSKKKGKVDPEIMKLRAKYQKEVKEYQKAKGSENKLKRIIDQMLPGMTKADLEKLYDYLGTMATPPLPGTGNAHTRKPTEAEVAEGETLTEPKEETNDPWLTE